MRHCRKCGKAGHNAATCGKEKKGPKNPGSRRCGRCGKTGHNARTCDTDLSTLPEGHRLLLEQKQRVVIDDGEGNLPRKGLWIISPRRKKVYGKILQIKRDGTVVWQNVLGANINSEPEVFQRDDHTFVELEAPMLQWGTTV